MQRLYVPATIANLGSGFDVFGVALEIYLEIEFKINNKNIFIYEGEGNISNNTDNIVHQAVRAAFAAAGEDPPALEIRAYNPIPLARGMGSSAAARVAGVMIADRLLDGGLGTERVFQIAAKLEGHPDNVAPAVFGGVQLSLPQTLIRVDLVYPEDLLFIVAVPSFELPTEAARKVLPDKIARSDAIFNLARAALWPVALATGDLGLMREAAGDRIHQPYRLELMPGGRSALEAAEALGAPAFVSGAGPAIAAICRGDPTPIINIFSNYIGDSGQIYTLSIGKGAKWKAT